MSITVASGKRGTYKATSAVDTFIINDDTKGATITNVTGGDIIAIEGFAADFTAKVSGRTVTLTSTVDTALVIKFQLANATGATASVRFLDGDLTATYTATVGSTKAHVDLGTQKLTAKAVAVSDAALGANDSVSTFDETSGGGSSSTGTTFTLTTGIDNGSAFVGTSNNDTFTANTSAGVITFTSLDAIDGGLGSDTLNVTVVGAITTAAAVGATVTGIEAANLTATTTITADTSAWTGLTSLVTSSIGDQALTAATTTDVTLTVAGAADAAHTINGGKTITTATTTTTDVETNDVSGSTIIGATTQAVGAVNVTHTEIATQTANATGSIGAGSIITVNGGTTVTVNSLATVGAGDDVTDALTLGAVTVNGGTTTTAVTVTQSAATAAWALAGDKIKITNGAVNITDVNDATTTADKITTVTLANFGATEIKSSALNSLTVSEAGSGAAGALTLTRTAADTAPAKTLALNVAGGSSVGAISGTHAADFTTVNVTTTGTTAATIANVTFAGATTLNVAGTAALTFTDNTLAAVTAITTGASDVTFGTTAIGTGVTYTGGAGADAFGVGATTKAITTGGGDDAVTMSVAVGTGGSVDAGTGTNTLVMTADNAETVSGATTFETGISNFTRLSVDNSSGAINLANLDDINYVTVTGAGGTNTFSSALTGATLVVAAASTSNTVTLATDGTADTLNVTLTNAASTNYGTVVATTFETVALTATESGTVDVDPTVIDTATAVLTDATAKTITVAGNANLALTFAGTALTSLNASANTRGGVSYTTDALAAAATLTGGAGINTLNAAAAVAAVTITGGAGVDTLTGSATIASSLNGAAGNDILTGGAAADVITGGDGTDTFVFSSANVVEQVGTGTTSGAVINLGATAITASDLYTATAQFLPTAVATVAANTATYLYSNESATNASVVDTLSGIESVTGTNLRDYIVGSAAANTITGGAGADTLTGGAGIDTFNDVGTAGNSIIASADTLVTGGAGIIAGNTVTFATGVANTVDYVTDFAATDLINVATAAVAPTTMLGLSDGLDLVTGTTYVAYGTYAATTGIFTIAAAFDATTAKDALVVVGDAGALTFVTTTGYVVLDNLTAALAAANFV